LRPDILTLLEKISETPMRVELSTNAVKIPEAFFERLDELKLFNVQVSLDGVGSRHDQFRGLDGAFAAASRSIERLREAGLEVSISTTATAVNLDQIPEIIAFARSMGCHSYKAIAFLPAGRGRENQRLKLKPEQQLELCRILMKKREEMKGLMEVSLGTTRAYLLEPRSRVLPVAAPDEKVTCSAGNDILNIGADGTLYPCPFLRDFPLGHALKDSIQAIWIHSPVLNRLRDFKVRNLPPTCRGCDSLGLCRGGCRAAAFLEHGDLNGMDPSCFKHLCAPGEIAACCGG
jgi:radical SAM protein with 4Fe4S-binding SPASM domain